MNSNTILTIKVMITLSLAAAGIGYVLYTPPTSQISNYEKRPMQTPNISQREKTASKKTDNEANDSISLTGKKGRYDETKIGKDAN